MKIIILSSISVILFCAILLNNKTPHKLYAADNYNTKKYKCEIKCNKKNRTCNARCSQDYGLDWNNRNLCEKQCRRAELDCNESCK